VQPPAAHTHRCARTEAGDHDQPERRRTGRQPHVRHRARTYRLRRAGRHGGHRRAHVGPCHERPGPAAEPCDSPGFGGPPMSFPAAVLGTGQTHHVAKRTDVSMAGLCREAIDRALTDSGLTMADIDAIVIGKAPDMFEGMMMPELYLDRKST